MYDDKVDGDALGALDDACKLVDETSEYGLTCAIFASDRTVIRFLENRLRDASGMFYINCKAKVLLLVNNPLGEVVLAVQMIRLVALTSYPDL